MPSRGECLHARRLEPRRLLLDMPLVPEREGEQPPELAAPVLPAGSVLVDEARYWLGLEEALALQVLRRQRLARERLEVAAQPRRCRDREAALASVHHLGRHEWLERFPQQHLLRESAHLEARRQREGEVRHERIEERHARLER